MLGIWAVCQCLIKMLVVAGITGSIGCGKSTVTRLLGEMGALTLDADQLAKEILAPGTKALQEVVARFGEGILIPGAQPYLNRSLLAKQVFADPDARRELEAIVHPRVFQKMAATLARWDQETLATSGQIVALEIPLLLETNSDALCDVIVVVTCQDQQLKRLQTRQGFQATCQQNIITQQMPELQKCQRAHWIINNSGTPADTMEQTQRLWAFMQTRLQTTPLSWAWPIQWKPHIVSV